MPHAEKDPTRIFTRGIAEASEGGPFHEKSLQGGGLVPSTWGDVASRLVEADIVEPTVQAVCDFLFIEPDDLSNPRLYFKDLFVADVYFSKIKKRWEDEYQTEFGDLAGGHSKYMHELMSTTWAAPEDAEKQADDIQEQIEETLIKRRRTDLTDEEEQQTDLLCLKRDALRSGVVVSLGDFARAVLEYPGKPYFTPDEFAKSLWQMLDYDSSLRTLLKSYPDTKVENIIIGEDQIDGFFSGMKGIWVGHKRKFAEAKWQEVEPIFFAPHHEELPVFAGNEK